MSVRAMWKGVIHLDETEVPIKLYAAVQDRAVHFRLLDARDHAPVRQKMVDPDSDEVVAPEEIRRAWEADNGGLVILEEEELAELEPEASREIGITRFVPEASVPTQWYDRPYYLGPDSSDSSYFALAHVLREHGLVGITHWVMRKKEYRGALSAVGDYLVLITLRQSGEVVLSSSLQPPAGRELDQREVSMAHQLIEAMSGELDMGRYRDEYRDRVRELVEAKAEGKVVRFPKPTERAAEAPLDEMLARSLEAVGKERKSA